MELMKKVCLIALFPLLEGACSDVQETDCCHSYYTLVNQSDYEVSLKYKNKYDYTHPVCYDTIIRKGASYTMEVIWDIPGLPFHDVDTLQVSFGSELVFEDYSRPRYFQLIRFSVPSYYEFTEESEYINRATYTITNADYEYSKQKLAGREAGKEGNEGERVNGYSREGRR